MLPELARILALELRPGDRVLLEGPMGAGKTTFSRYLLLALGVSQPPEGSPTFAIAHEYALTSESSGLRGVVHVDLYRIRSEEEIDERGIPDYYWDSGKIVLSEWTSMWPGFERQVLQNGQNWRVELSFSEQNAELRDIKIMRPDRRLSAR
jgi:tRNA threonylcarbamoyladenosine biosynthesis protein TsaE